MREARMSKSGRDPLLLNKVLGGILTAGIVLWAGVHIADGLMNTAPPEKPAIKIAGGYATAAVAAVATGIPSINNLIPKANIQQGKTFAGQQCAACHSLNKGGANGVGPNLWGVMNAPMFAKAGYTFSSAAKKKAKGNWSYHKMNEWLYDPAKYVPGTHMTYGGIKNTNVRADVVAYLRTLSIQPIPLPKPKAKIAAVPPEAGKTAATPAAEAAGNGAPPIASLYATAAVSKGQGFFQQQCAACHSINKGGPNGVGPNLYGVVQEKMFAKAGYSFSSAAKKKATGNWTPHLLNQWLYDPMKFAPGTHMSYPGIKNNKMRANVIAYLNHESTHPADLRKAAPAAAAYKSTAETNPQGNAPGNSVQHPGGTQAAKQAAAKTGAASGGTPAGASGVPSITKLYATGAVAKGQAFFQQQCAACHSVTKGGPNGVGPNLYGVVGSKKFAKAGYSFSSAAKKHAHGVWTPHALNRWLYDPMKYAPGTHMSYPGVKNDQTRASVVEYLNSLSPSPEKLPGEK
jgi:cytochrome c